ncbi:hypothetical protein BDQ12DRAFT_671565 [Crucibulum laeve]|uniref:Uncharacterized protein n=1 Tax=Crucibulum laeve TaxID=68775 RepID=A0A5C3LGS8_9AGAR|nr:hypothetical protein BDQ12DRAFT_671565 [Crucibulum laeve]
MHHVGQQYAAEDMLYQCIHNWVASLELLEGRLCKCTGKTVGWAGYVNVWERQQPGQAMQMHGRDGKFGRLCECTGETAGWAGYANAQRETAGWAGYANAQGRWQVGQAMKMHRGDGRLGRLCKCTREMVGWAGYANAQERWWVGQAMQMHKRDNRLGGLCKCTRETAGWAGYANAWDRQQIGWAATIDATLLECRRVGHVNATYLLAWGVVEKKAGGDSEQEEWWWQKPEQTTRPYTK